MREREREARERTAVERERRERELQLRGVWLLLLYYRNFKKNETINRKLVICEKLGHIFESPIVKLGSYKINPFSFTLYL